MMAFARRHERALGVALALAIVLVGLAWTAHVCGGADTYGYVSQADLWHKGWPIVHQDFGIDAPWSSARFTLSPLGYHTAVDGYDLVPTYSPGLPLLMAGASAIGGRPALYAIVPIAAGLLVLATAGIGRRIGRPVVGLVAAVFVATSPAVLFMTMSPMSDVPAAAAWAVALWCALGETTGLAATAGLATSIAILIRPNLLPVGAIVGLWIVARDLAEWRTRAWRRFQAPVFAATSALGPIAVGVIFNHLYGSPWVSGYGQVPGMFSVDHVRTNLANYLTWTTTSGTPLATAGLIALAIGWSRLWPSATARRARWLFAGLTVGVWAIYLVYLSFDAWWYLRFLLPAWPVMAIGSAAIVAAIFRDARAWTTAAALATVLLVGTYGVAYAVRHQVFALGAGEQKYYDMARLIDATTKPDDVILALQHSGSIRYYGRRMTVRWDLMDHGTIDDAVAWMEARGHHVYLVLEPWEVDLMRQRFGETDRLAKLDWQPIAILRDGAVALYDTSGRQQAPPTVVAPYRIGWEYPAPSSPLHFSW